MNQESCEKIKCEGCQNNFCSCKDKTCLGCHKKIETDGYCGECSAIRANSCPKCGTNDIRKNSSGQLLCNSCGFEEN